MTERPYRPLESYGVIGGLRTAALLADDGSIDWCCLPELDSPSVFGALLDAGRGGRWRFGLPDGRPGAQRYLERTNVLETTFVGPAGTARVTDFMPCWEGLDGGPEDPSLSIVRIACGLEGTTELVTDFEPRPDYGRTGPRFEATADGVRALSPLQSLSLTSTFPLELQPGRARGTVRLRAGQSAALVASPVGTRGTLDPHEALERTVTFWRAWAHHCDERHCVFRGPWHDLVVRSELLLKLLTHRGTGGIAAAFTTSLPEVIGGERNWDYRFSWIRDASFTVHALYHLGHTEQLHAFVRWIREYALRGHSVERLASLYTLRGERPPTERFLEHLEGYRGSRPVRTGNMAADQRQIDIYGEILDAAFQVWRYGLEDPDESLGGLVGELADHVCDIWREPDSGIWEMRTERRHFVYSKVMCWVALDRAVRLAEEHEVAGHVDRWRAERDAIRASILTHGVDARRGTFVQAYGEEGLDAALLLIPILGFLPVDDPRVARTIAAVESELTDDGLVRRYRTPDGLAGHEGGFAWCTFWLVDCLSLQGRIDEAEALLMRMLERANPLGLFSEEIDVRTGALLGNFPQAFTHVGVINSALYLNTMKARQRSTRLIR